MRLFTCHVENFGRLQDLDLDFRSGLHTVEEPNGWGKSTLAAFLQVMFYGFANEKSRSELGNERRRYAPWQQGIYGGSVTFSWKGHLYRIERVFGLKNAKEDQTAVYDAETNLPVGDLPDNPGETLFAIDRDSFARTVFVAQQDCGTEATSGIQAKIGHLEGENADMADYQTVQTSLKKQMDAQTQVRKTGDIHRLRLEKAQCESDAARRPICEETLEKLQEQLDKRELRVNRLKKETEVSREELRQLSVTQQTAANFLMEDAELLRLRQLDAVFSDGQPQEQELEEAELCLAEIRKMRSDFDREQRELYDPHDGRTEDQPVRRGTSLASVLVFALFASALLAFFVNRYAAAALAALAVVIMVVVVRRDMKEEKEEGPQKPVVVVKQRTSPLDKAEDLRRKKEELKEARSRIQEAEEELLAFLRQYYPDMTEEEDLSRTLQRLQYEKAEYTALLEKKEKADAAKEAWQESMRTARQALAETGSRQGVLSVVDLEMLIAENTERIEQDEDEIAGICQQISDVEEDLDRLSDTEERLQDLEEQIQNKLHRYEVIRQTSAYLAKARAAFTARYMEPVNQAFDRYYRMLTGEERKDYQLDADLQISVREWGVLRDPAFLSEGWQDLIGLCRRMAMIDAMYEAEKPFLIFDDPFVNLDGEKLEKALAFLKQIAERYQVLYFTCHESRVPR